ncbi:uncharacterized protein TrAFT101_006572 [Trichoderma asperellum]|uniref:uncharacterized protein n=1 Tax=Trichoderma asperellum TaxID=101201 RepID=UPI0033341D9F|nr:hypothetical protein TrAFT101_006572 [Trichoderma asperellum]
MSSPAGLPLDATITIVNNSGKLISTGKQLLSIWKTAQTSYREKKTELSEGRAQERAAERAPPPVPVKRAQTFDTGRSIPRRQYDELSVASSARTYKSSIAKKQLPPVPNQLALTEGNLEKLSEVSSVAPSKAPSSYGGINNNNAMVVKGSFSRVDPPMALQKVQPRMVGRTRSDTEIEAQKRFSMGSDLHLAYGDIPPDLADRVDLDKHTAYSEEPTLYDEQQHIEDEREQAEQLIHKIENLLDEASCAQHSATAIITHLQERPDAAAAVALTLAELSGIITKLSPGFAAILKGTSPAIFALLASPQFLIGTGIAVGVTVVMFGGWKIVQRIAQNSVGAKKPMAYEAAAAPLPQIDNGVDEAIVLETVEVDISSIDTWRRGITTEFEAADMELMTPEADRVVRERRASGVPEDYFDSKSRKSSKTQHRSKTHSSSHSSSSHKSHRSKESSDRKSSSSGRRKSLESNSSGSLSLFKRSLSGSKKKSDEGSVKGGSVKNEEMTVKAKMRQNNNMLKALFKSKEHRQSIAT